MTKCLINNCTREAKTRGLCKMCYTSASNSIKRGKVHSWEQLIELGLALPSASQDSSVFTKALESKLAHE